MPPIPAIAAGTGKRRGRVWEPTFAPEFCADCGLNGPPPLININVSDFAASYMYRVTLTCGSDVNL